MTIQISSTASVLFGVCACIGLFVLFFGYLLWSERRKGRFSPFTENFFRLPGHSARKCQEELIGELMINYVLFIIISAVIICSAVYGIFSNVTIFLCFIGLIYLIYKSHQLFVKAHKYRLGYEGEEFTGQELNLLMRKGAYVFHDIPYKYGNIDHIVVGLDKVFVVETKTYRKPKKNNDSDASRHAKVVYDGATLKFPGFTTADPLDQATTASNYVKDALSKKLGKPFTVIPVVALPGWYVEDASTQSDVMVINPKRGNGLRKHMGDVRDYELRQQVVRYFAAVSRSYTPGSRITDSDAGEKFDFWHNPKESADLLWDR